MYWLQGHKKRDPDLRWALPDRIFFGRGACHILAGIYLNMRPLPGFHAERIIPANGFAGNHIYVTNDEITFDFHGYATRPRLVSQHIRGWSKRYPGWDCIIERVDFNLLDTASLNERKMLGPDQYRHDPMMRGRNFIERVDHVRAARRATDIARGDQTTMLDDFSRHLPNGTY